MADKPAKIGFKIKLSNETSEKLKQVCSKNIDVEKEFDSPLNVDSPVKDPVNLLPNTTKNIGDVKFMQGRKPESIDDRSSDVPGTIAPVCENVFLENDQQINIPVRQTSCEAKTNNYAEHIHYEGEVAVYTDPVTKYEYIWSSTQNNWTPRSENIGNIPSELGSTTEQTGQRGFENDTHTYTDKDGSGYVWDIDKKAWFPKVDDEFLAHYQMSYGFVDNTTPEKEDVTAKAEEAEAKELKRKGPPEPPKWFDVSEEQNTNVYVSNLPLDITEEEFVDLMQKCGLVMRDPTTQKMKIKLYTKPNSKQLKGDALCTYIKIESVELALNILDGSTVKNHRIQVQKAQFQMKGEYDPNLKPKKKRRKDKEKIKKMQEKLFDWRPEKFRGERSKHEKVVIIKNVFEPSMFDTEVQLILEFQQDLREECAKCGEVKKVVLYDRHPEGVAQVSMKEPEDADNVVKLVNGRWFGKRQLTAEIWDGKTRYKMEETDADLNKRLGKWEEFLEDPETKRKREALEAESSEKTENTLQENVDIIATQENNQINLDTEES